ncbi:MAG: ATP-binding cassette domain-containing protein [Candidatus Izemoplasmatales bacterium]|nr:ATP-binding cassette domain-containing protein [Candidatus Izemoplasmatales bacterium]
MLTLKEIKKDYVVAGKPIPALNGISLHFKENEFVSILGQSGSGKTTLLNIIGGLDRYTSGDLLIDGKSTKDFQDSDWDAYRNQTIGFVFQTYNLITHLSVLDNVEMALRLSGVSAAERRSRAIQVLTEVGLADQIYKRPNQLSGGQMQRVAIARALVNNPKVLLADEPTGALDSKTSKQIMALISEIAKDRLVIMVTHNSEIAKTYSDRIILLVDGQVMEDSHPQEAVIEQSGKLKTTKTSMSFFTALKTSLKNLLTKKGRTIITSIAGSIGIIGIALVLSISTGMTNYVTELQSDALAGFPITISKSVSTDRFGPGANGPLNQNTNTFPTNSIITPYDRQEATTTHTNIINQAFIDYLNAMDPTLRNSISYSRAIGIHLLAQTSSGGVIKVVNTAGTSFFSSGTRVISEVPNNPAFILSQYDVLSGTYPTDYTKLVLVVDENNRLDTTVLEALGIELAEEYTFDDLIGKTFKLLLNDFYYHEVAGVFRPRTDYEVLYDEPSSITLEIAAILRVKKEASSSLLNTGLGYSSLLTDFLLENAQTSNIVLAQQSSPDINILSGNPFTTTVTYTTVMSLIGGDSTPTGVQIYPKSFDSKDDIKAYLDAYNEGVAPANAIIYADLAETISSTISGLIDTITIVLTAFAAVSLVVSSIMIGIITYVSVVERTKEIGIMRSLGARKRDISRIFNAETIWIGLTAGSIGIGIAYLLHWPINVIVDNLIGVKNIASLTITNGLFLVVLSIVLTLLAGLIPSGIAARKDPVVALRTE